MRRSRPRNRPGIQRPPAPPQAYVHRRYQGFGDWLFALAVCKMVNRQRPDVELVVHHRLRNGLPAQAWRVSDVRYRSARPSRRDFCDVYELIYRKWPPNGYIESTVANWNDLTPWPIEYEPGVYPEFRNTPPRSNGGFALMVGHSKMTERGNREWGHVNWRALATDLSRTMPVIQVGAARDLHLPNVSARYLGDTFVQLVRLMRSCRFYCGPENGLTVLAGYLGVPQVTMYDGHQVDPPFNRAERLDFADHLKIERPVEPPEAYEEVMTWLESRG